MLAVVLAAAPALRADRLTGLLAGVGAVGVVGFVYGLLRGFPGAVPWAVVLLAGAYAGSLFLPERGIDGDAPVFALGLVLLAELACWTLELRTPMSPEPGMLSRRTIAVAAAALGALVVASLAIVATAIPLGGGVVADLIGIAAAVAALAMVARLAERGRQSST